MHNYKKQNGTFQMAFALKTLFKNYCTKHKRKELFYINNPYGKIPRLEIPLNIKINQQKEGGSQLGCLSSLRAAIKRHYTQELRS